MPLKQVVVRFWKAVVKLGIIFSMGIISLIIK